MCVCVCVCVCVCRLHIYRATVRQCCLSIHMSPCYLCIMLLIVMTKCRTEYY